MPSPAADSRSDYRQRSEPFDVVLVKDGVNVWEAMPADFKRVSVQAAEPSAARAHEDVAAVQGYKVHRVMGPGTLSPEENDARARAAAAPTGPKDLPAPTSTRDKHGRNTYPMDVVMTKAGVSSLAAKPEEFKRVRVSAADGAEARRHDDVAAAEVEGWVVNQIVQPGVKTQDEYAAEQRAYAEAMGPGRS